MKRVDPDLRRCWCSEILRSWKIAEDVLPDCSAEFKIQDARILTVKIVRFLGHSWIPGSVVLNL